MTTPEPLSIPLGSGSSSIVIDGHEIKVLMSLNDPKVIVFGNILTSEECDAFADMAKQNNMQRSFTVNPDGGEMEHADRTSEQTYFAHNASPLVEKINTRVSQLLQWPIEKSEPFQVLRYKVGAQYVPHYDYFPLEHAATPAILARGGQRVGTLILYLNTPIAGGATIFPQAGLEVAPIRGNGVFFSYDKPEPSTKSLHGGTKVVAGEKWVATRWLREGAFV